MSDAGVKPQSVPGGLAAKGIGAAILLAAPLVMFFEGKDKGLVMNKTNWNATVEITGQEDSDDWAGAKVKLVMRKVDFQGKRVPAIRIEEPTVTAAPLRSKPKAEAPPVVDEIDDSEIPFAWLLPLLVPAVGLFSLMVA